MSANSTADIVVIGGGVIGCSTAYNLVRQGAKNVVLLERNDVCSGGTAKSCAICRTHYSIEPNLVHAVESLKIFEHFAEVVGGEAGFHRTGYIILGPEAHREPMEAVFRTQNKYGIDTATLTPDEAHAIHPLLQFDDVGVIGYDTRAGYCDPYLTTNSYVRRARELGVDVRTSTPVTRLELDGPHPIVHTPAGSIEAGALVLAAGPWTNELAQPAGMTFPYEVSRHKVITLRIGQDYDLDWPTVKDLTTPTKIYFRPETGGVVLVGTGDHGDPIEDADYAARRPGGPGARGPHRRAHRPPHAGIRRRAVHRRLDRPVRHHARLEPDHRRCAGARGRVRSRGVFRPRFQDGAHRGQVAGADGAGPAGAGVDRRLPAGTFRGR